MSDVGSTAAGRPVRFTSDFITSPTFAAELTAATFRLTLLRPVRIVAYALIVIIIGVGVFATTLSGGATSASLGPEVFLGVYLVVFAGIYFAAYQVGRQRVAKRMPAGSLYSLTLFHDTMLLADPMAKTELSYALFKSARRQGDFVRIDRRIGRLPVLLPSQLFTDDSLAWLTARLQATAPSGN